MVIIDLLADLLLAHRDCFFDFDFVLKQAYIQIAGTRRVRDVVYLPYLSTFTLRILLSGVYLPRYIPYLSEDLYYKPIHVP